MPVTLVLDCLLARRVGVLVSARRVATGAASGPKEGSFHELGLSARGSEHRNFKRHGPLPGSEAK